MCGIMAYIGNKDAKEVVLQGLKDLEYRGYDSAGLAIRNGSNNPQIIRAVGKVDQLVSKVAGQQGSATLAMGHTRWATHGPANETNCHPHQSGKVLLVHNGIIENYAELKAELEGQGYQFTSATDSEVVAALLDYYYQGRAEEALEKALPRLNGSYALAIHFLDQPEILYCAKLASSLILTMNKEEVAASSDILGTAPIHNQFIAMPDRCYARIKPGEIKLYELGNRECELEWQIISWNIEQAQKQGHEYFMHKEIHETPEAIERTIAPRIRQDHLELELPQGFALEDTNEIVVVGCGTALHAGMVAKQWFEQKLAIPCRTEIASEFRYSAALLRKQTLVVAISQSGETADTLAALRLAKSKHAKTLAIVNVKGSAIAQEADAVLYTHAGPEIAVASTKAYSVQLVVLYLLMLAISKAQGKLDSREETRAINSLKELPQVLKAQLQDESEHVALGEWLKEHRDAFFVGRGLDYAVAMEASIKLKEISYIHSEAYAAGELKHGTLSLVEENTPVIAIASVADLHEKMQANICELKSRGAKILLLASSGFPAEQQICDYSLKLAELPADFLVFSLALHLQFLAYYTAKAKGLDVDHPRNLAKSVTVE